MSLYYPQAAVILRVTWEDFGTEAAVLKQTGDIRVSAKNVVVERNDYSEADTVKVSFDYNAFPFDPRCVRACGISVFMANQKRLFHEDSKAAILQPNDLPIEAEDSNKVFVGFADESTITFDDESRTVTMEGRDFTGLFIDQKRVNTDPIPLSKPIDQIISDLIQEQEATKLIEVVNRTGEDLPTLAKLAPDFNPTTAVKNQSRKETYWDIMISILGRVGLIGFIELDKFIITKPQNIYEKKQIKHFIYGGNIKDLNFKRKLGRAKNFNVKVVSFNALEKRVEEAKIPEEATAAHIKGPRVTIPQLDKDGKKIDPPKDADFITFTVKDVTSKDQLIKIGEAVFEEMSRQQIEGSLTTYEMEIPEEDSAGVTSAINFSQIRNGTAIRIFLAQEELRAISSNSTDAQKKAFLLKRGYPDALATAFSQSLNRINTAFYTRSVSFELDQESGFTMKLEFVNFIDLDSALVGGA